MSTLRLDDPCGLHRCYFLLACFGEAHITGLIDMKHTFGRQLGDIVQHPTDFVFGDATGASFGFDFGTRERSGHVTLRNERGKSRCF